MRAKTIQIIWHDKEPVFSIDFDPINEARFATAGGDNNVYIWELKEEKVEFLSSLSRHNGPVNCVRWCPLGKQLASSGDDGSIIIWEKTDQKSTIFGKEDDNSIEFWKAGIILRGATSDLYDLAWSLDGKGIASAGIDYTVRIFDVLTQKCTHVLTHHNHFVQGVAWDPLSKFIATQSGDRAVHIYSYDRNESKAPKLLQKHTKLKSTAVFKINKGKGTRLYQDEDMNSFFRRLQFSPDGQILVTPAGITENDKYCLYLYDRQCIQTGPYQMLPGYNRSVVAVRFNKVKFVGGDSYIYYYAVISLDQLVIYRTDSDRPYALLGNMHYSPLTDVTWSKSGLNLLISSTDGFCSLVEFTPEELGEIYEEVSTINCPVEETCGVGIALGTSTTDSSALANQVINDVEINLVKTVDVPNAIVDLEASIKESEMEKSAESIGKNEMVISNIDLKPKESKEIALVTKMEVTKSKELKTNLDGMEPELSEVLLSEANVRNSSTADFKMDDSMEVDEAKKVQSFDSVKEMNNIPCFLSENDMKVDVLADEHIRYDDNPVADVGTQKKRIAPTFLRPA